MQQPSVGRIVLFSFDPRSAEVPAVVVSVSEENGSVNLRVFPNSEVETRHVPAVTYCATPGTTTWRWPPLVPAKPSSPQDPPPPPPGKQVA